MGFAFALVLHQKQWESQAHKIPIVTHYYKKSDQIGRECKQPIRHVMHSLLGGDL